MTEEELVRYFPRLWHMAEDGSFESIRKHGLLSTSSLLDLYEVKGKARVALESQRRPESVKISKAGLPDAIIRDQKPMTESALHKCLSNLTPKQWFEILNDRAFFWLSLDRLRGLLNARAYRGRPQIVLTVDTASLLSAHKARIELSPLNSGATIYNPQPRGLDTFLSITKYPFEDWVKKRKSPGKSVVELVVRGGVPDVAQHLVAAHHVDKGARKQLWLRSGADPNEGP